MDLGFVNENKWFRFRACAVIVRNNKILMCKNKVDDYYYSVGGGVNHGEKIEDAVIREVFEETGKTLEIDRLLFIHQNFFDGNFSLPLEDELKCHEIAFYFLMKETDKDLISVGKTTDNKEETTVWLEFNDFKTKPVYPKFLPEMLNSKEVNIVSSYETK